jgi:plasmid stability protein
MSSLTIRNLDDDLERRLRARAAAHGRSVEDEIREILRRATTEANGPDNLGRAVHRRFTELGGVELDLPERDAMREPPRFR